MKKQSFWLTMMLGTLLVVFAGIPPAMADPYQLGGDEESVMGAMETASPEIALGGDERPVMEASETSSQELTNWAAAYESFDVLETGALPPAVPREPWTGDSFSE
jgi:hypothetical protein